MKRKKTKKAAKTKTARKPRPAPKPKAKPKTSQSRKKTKELSERKKQIVRLVCKQMTSQEIGDKLGLSKKTVEVHRLQIFDQVKVRNNVGLAIWAIKNGVFQI
jgi:DNA-binding NarL/FixJ family response regulator